MRLIIVGSAAGGGFPQWNCNYYLSRAARRGDPHINARTQSSLAVTGNDQDWVLFNASPDIRTQIAQTAELHPRFDGPLRSSPIAAVVLTNADVDHIAGLLSLREQQAFVIYATERVLQILNDNPIFNVVNRDVVERKILMLDKTTELLDAEGRSLNITIEAFAVPGKVALFLENPDDLQSAFTEATGDTIGLRINQSNGVKSAFYIPGCAAIDLPLRTRLQSAPLLMFDGTVFTDNEMPDAGIGKKTGARMGHIAISGPDGSLAQLNDLNIQQKIFLHINNTNPILDAQSKEAAFVRDNGWEIAFDGMELTYE